eukprot:2218732-Pyramimonas_sp.AAC.1
MARRLRDAKGCATCHDKLFTDVWLARLLDDSSRLKVCRQLRRMAAVMPLSSIRVERKHLL